MIQDSQAYSTWYRPLEKQVISTVLPTCHGYHLLLAGNTDLSQVEDSPTLNHWALRESKRLGFSGVIARYDEMPFPSDSIDVLVLTHALSHCDDPSAALKEVTRVLHHNGHLIITGLNPFRSLARDFFAYESRSHPVDGKMLPLFELKSMLHQQGYEILKCKRFGGFVRDSVVSRFLDKLFMKCFNGFSCGYLVVAKKRSVKLATVRYKVGERRLVGKTEVV